MNRISVDVRWLLAESFQIGAIILTGFLLAHLLSLFIGGFGLELLYGIENTLVAVLRYTTLITALLYAATEAIDTLSPSVVHNGD